jgi:hypothetical protein
VDEARPSIIKYAGPTPKQVLTAQVQPSVQATMQPGQKLKSKWADTFNATAQSAQEINDVGPSAHHHVLPGPLRAAPPTQGPPMLQHASPGPSGTQVQPGFANMSIFSYLSKNKTIFQPNINLSQRY